MLVLSRRADQSVVIPGLGVCIRVIAIEGNRVRLGFEAPDDVIILRSELLKADGAMGERSDAGTVKE